jgi:hypothetical protein
MDDLFYFALAEGFFLLCWAFVILSTKLMDQS